MSQNLPTSVPPGWQLTGKHPDGTPEYRRVPARGDTHIAADAVENESALHYDIIAACMERGIIYLHGSMAAATHRTAGEPDFILICEGGKVLFIECKTRAGKLSPAQLAFKVAAEMRGHTIHICRSLSEFDAILKANNL